MTFSTGFIAVIGSAFLAAHAAPTAPTWQNDYSIALTKAVEAKKPLAVFIGHGKTGQSAIISGGMGESETKALANSYVCLYIDADTDAGKKLASSFEIKEGVVISDRTGGLQAVRHEGPVSKAKLNDYLTRYSDPSRVVTTTEYGGQAQQPAVTTYNVNGITSGSYVPYCPSCQRR